jgi:farnesyl-diphosphate farnesyltransferase
VGAGGTTAAGGRGGRFCSREWCARHREALVNDAANGFRLTSAQKKYLEQQLDKVSRSFALVIPFIEPPVRDYLATAYLLCRVADNIEDCAEPHAWKQARFEEFQQMLDAPQAAARTLGAWEQCAWPGLRADERQMMGAGLGLPLWQIYAAIPDPVRAHVSHWIGVMATGMSRLGDGDQPPTFVRRQGIDVLATELDYNAYCYYVAGTVGALASELIIQEYELPAAAAATLQARADACGRSLQKTNIVKDFAEDVRRGVCYLPDTWLHAVDHAPLVLQGADLPWKARVIGNVLAELRDAVEYVLALPPKAQGYRRASLLCLFSSYHTMLAAAQRHTTLFTAAHQVKISRATMVQCMSDAGKLLRDDQAIRRYCLQMADEVHARIGPAPALTAP